MALARKRARKTFVEVYYQRKSFTTILFLLVALLRGLRALCILYLLSIFRAEPARFELANPNRSGDLRGLIGQRIQEPGFGRSIRVRNRDWPDKLSGIQPPVSDKSDVLM